MSRFAHLRFQWVTSRVALAAAFGTFVRMRYFGPSGIRWIQKRKLDRLLRFAAREVPYYRARLGASKGPLRLQDFPIVSKERLMEDFEQFVSDPRVTYAGVTEHIESRRMQTELYLDRYVICTTSGTTGRAGAFVIDAPAWGLLRSVAMSRMFLGTVLPYMIARRLRGKKLNWAYYIAYGNNNITYLLCKYLPAVIGFFVNIRLFSVHEPVRQIGREIAEFEPDLIHAYPTSLSALADEMLRDPSISIQPRVITTGSEPFAAEAQRLVARAFPGARIFQAYGSTEFTCIAHQCGHGNYHLNADYCEVEVTGAGPADRRILLTNLNNRVQPLIRYEISDAVELEDSTCDCGRPLPILRISGRTDETLYLRDRGGEFHPVPPIPIQDLFFTLTGIRKFRVVHSRQNHLVVSFDTVDPAGFEQKKPLLETAFVGYLRKNGLDDVVTMEFEPLIEGPAKPGAKHRAIYSLVEPPPAQNAKQKA